MDTISNCDRISGMLRHLGSLRRMKRDNGWIETLWEESFNERMHLCKQAGWSYFLAC